MKKYAKFYVAFAAFLAVLAQVVADGAVSADEAGVLVTAAIAAAGVFGVPNKVDLPPEVVKAIEAADANVAAVEPIFVAPEARADSNDGGYPGQ